MEKGGGDRGAIALARSCSPHLGMPPVPHGALDRISPRPVRPAVHECADSAGATARPPEPAGRYELRCVRQHDTDAALALRSHRSAPVAASAPWAAGAPGSCLRHRDRDRPPRAGDRQARHPQRARMRRNTGRWLVGDHDPGGNHALRQLDLRELTAQSGRPDAPAQPRQQPAETTPAVVIDIRGRTSINRQDGTCSARVSTNRRQAIDN